MQSLVWYVRRFGRMSSQEIAWRIRSNLRDVMDWPRLALRLHPRSARALPSAGRSFEPGFRVADVEVGEWSRPTAAQAEQEWCRRLVERARHSKQRC